MSIKFVGQACATVVVAVVLGLPTRAQQTPPPSNTAPSSSQTDAAGKQSPSTPPGAGKDNEKASQGGDQKNNSGTSNDRLFYTLPNFLTMENTGQLPPLTTGQKFKVVARGSFDYIQIPWYGFLAGIAQAENSEPGYGQGASGYGKRFVSDFADGTIENFLTGAILPTILREDPRFYQLGKGSFSHRTGYAVSRIFVTKTDSRRTEFNYSEIVGSALSAAISTYSYHPRSFITHRFDPATGMTTTVFNPSDRTLTNTAKVWGTQVGYDTITIVVKEFWPDIHRKFSHKNKADGMPPEKPANVK